MSAELCSVCARLPHAIDDPECMPETKPIAEKLAWALDEIQRLRAALARQAPAPQAVPEGVLTIAREALQAVTFTDRTAMNDKGTAEIPFCTLRKCADAISAIDSLSAAAPEAPVAKVWMKDGEIQKAATYMPGLPDGEHELYAGPQPQAVTEYARDGERYRHLRAGTARTAAPRKKTVGRIEVLQWESPQEANVLKGEALDAAVDAEIAARAATSGSEGEGR